MIKTFILFFIVIAITPFATANTHGLINNQSYYEILGINPSAGQPEIKKAYHHFIKRNHPDVGGSVELMQEVNDAYDILSDPKQRQKYDLWLASQTHQSRHYGDLLSYPELNVELQASKIIDFSRQQALNHTKETLSQLSSKVNHEIRRIINQAYKQPVSNFGIRDQNLLMTQFIPNLIRYLTDFALNANASGQLNLISKSILIAGAVHCGKDIYSSHERERNLYVQFHDVRRYTLKAHTAIIENLSNLSTLIGNPSQKPARISLEIINGRGESLPADLLRTMTCENNMISNL